jgi:peptide/nickel transport system permease protein
MPSPPAADPPEFKQVSWDEVEPPRRLLTAERVVLLVGLATVAALLAYDLTAEPVTLVAGWDVSQIEWGVLGSVVVLLAYGLVPALRRRASVRRVLDRLRSRPAALAAGLFLVGFALVALLGPVVLSRPRLQFQYAFHPPVGFSTGVDVYQCLGETTGSVFDQRCSGTLEFPLGTNRRGHPMGHLLVSGARTALNVLLVTAALVVPVAVLTGLVAGTRGGRVDDLLMAYVDIQLSVPAVMVYFIGFVYLGPSLLLLVVAFGLFSWGGIARLVRSEVLQRRESGYVTVAESLGASRSYIARKHVLPNVTSTVVPAVFQLLALLVLVEAGVAFLGFHDISVYSWGATISEGLNAVVPGQVQNRAQVPAYRIWWVSTFPALALAATMLSLKLLGDALRDALDPRGRRE